LQKFVAENIDVRQTPAGETLKRGLHEYDRKLESHGIGPEHLSLAQFSRWAILRQALFQTSFLFVISPLAIPGMIVHFPAYRICGIFARIYARHGADDVASSVKVLAGMIFMPSTWIVIAAILYFIFGWQTALFSLPISVICGYAALYTLEEIAELSGWAKAIWLFLTKREAFLRMFVERRALQAQLREFD